LKKSLASIEQEIHSSFTAPSLVEVLTVPARIFRAGFSYAD